jgi:hypothetical protein
MFLVLGACRDVRPDDCEQRPERAQPRVRVPTPLPGRVSHRAARARLRRFTKGLPRRQKGAHPAVPFRPLVKVRVQGPDGGQGVSAGSGFDGGGEEPGRVSEEYTEDEGRVVQPTR